jgi:phospholipase/carboxylesterase
VCPRAYLSRLVIALALAATACSSGTDNSANEPHPSRLVTAAQVSEPTDAALADAGVHRLDVGDAGEALLYVPEGLDDHPAPLLVVLAGAGGDATATVAELRADADARSYLLLAPSPHEHTWDVIQGEWGPDVELLDTAMAEVLTTMPIDRESVTVAGFSDGATYALALGLANGDLFTGTAAAAPGPLLEVPALGAPRVFIAHGRGDEVEPVDSSRENVETLRDEGYEVEYVEFDGGHEMPPTVVERLGRWHDQT